jgi:hypothetical protein
MAVTLLALPAALVAVAVRYQAELRWGVGYLPVFFGIIGMSTLIALLYAVIARRVPAPVLACVSALLFGAAVGGNAVANSRVVLAYTPQANQRDELNDALRNGLLDDVNDQQMLLFDQRQIGPPAGFWLAGYGMTMKQWVQSITPRRPRDGAELEPGHPLAQRCTDENMCKPLTGPATWFTTGVISHGRRWVMLTPLRNTRLTPKTNLFFVPATPTARMAIEDADGATIAAAQAQWNDIKTGAPVSDAAKPKVVRRTGRWTFADVPVPDTVAAASGRVILTPPSAG